MFNLHLPTSTGEDFPCQIASPELIYGATALVVPTAIAVDIFHPLTHEKLPVVVLPKTKTPYLLIPAHIQKHFVIARTYHLPMKQVVAPLFQGSGAQTIRPDLPIQKRQSVMVVVKHWHDDSYLCVDSFHRNCKSFVLGGRENDESPAAAAVREVAEETGYTNLVVDSVYPIMLLNHFYADYKGVNRHATLHIVFCHLDNDQHENLTAKESNEHAVKWIAKNDLRRFLSVKNNLFALDIIENGAHAYAGDGLMVHSHDLDGLTRAAAKSVATELLV
ncbi:MAG: NUDIX domain-containing protein [Prevotella sp.]|nr:NUDIX domain-containing protein [Prevotella sp.]